MKKSLSFLAMCIFAFATFAQKSDTSIYNYGMGFEQEKIDPSVFKKVDVNLGGDFEIRYQSLKSHANSVSMTPLGDNINFPASNLVLNTNLAPGIKVNMSVYLASRHHSNTYVEGGYILIDQLPFLNCKLADKIMKYVTIKVGMMEMNYGDAHFRRSDNARTLDNPFIGNYILDGFAIPPAMEIYFRNNGLLVMGGLTEVITNPGLGQAFAAVKSADTIAAPSYVATYTPWSLGKELQYYFKVSYDKKINKNIRIRPTFSGYICPTSYGGTLYNSDRGGSPYEGVMNSTALGYDVTTTVANGYFGPNNYAKDNSFMGNLFARIYGFEFFGTYEIAKGNEIPKTIGVGKNPITGNGSLLPLPVNTLPFTINNASVEGLYYFGTHKQFDIGVRYTTVSKNAQSNVQGTDYKGTVYTIPGYALKMSTNRLQIAAGWRLTNNIMTKIEYVKQTYSNFAQYGTGTPFFEGFMVEAAISF